MSRSLWDLSSLTGNRTLTPCVGSMESQPLDYQEDPSVAFLKEGVPCLHHFVSLHRRFLPLSLSIQHFFTSFGARDRTYMMMFRLWQNALLEKVSPAPSSASGCAPTRMSLPLGWGPRGDGSCCSIGLLLGSPCFPWFQNSSRLTVTCPPLLVTQVLGVACPLK